MNNKKERSPLLLFILKHQYGLVWLGLYLFFICAGIHFDWVVSIVSSTIAIIFMQLLDRFVRYFLIKSYLQKHQQTKYYFFSVLALTIFVYAAVKIEFLIFRILINHNLIIPPETIQKEELAFPIFKIIILFLITYTVATVSYLLNETKITQKKNSELINQNLEMELRYLKAQMNPHFLFNALNNIYSMVYTNDENAAESLLKLSEMLRYVTDDCQSEKIALTKEIKYLDNYIDFQLMRMERHPNLLFEKEIENGNIKVTPMIFQPLLENCFKHSHLENDKNAYVHITLAQNKNIIHFSCENSKPSYEMNITNIREGIGIANVKKRLQLYYGNNFTLDIKNNPQFYKLKLTIKL